jgi:hypothetical protein
MWRRPREPTSAREFRNPRSWENCRAVTEGLLLKIRIFWQSDWNFSSGTVIAHLHTLSIQAHSYLDDSLLKEFDSEILSRHTCLFIRLLLDLGFLISWKKSQILPLNKELERSNVKAT